VSRTYRRSPTYHGTLRLPDGSSWSCHHQHRTPEAARECAQKYARRPASQYAQVAAPPSAPRGKNREYDLNRPFKDVWLHGTVGELLARRKAKKH